MLALSRSEMEIMTVLWNAGRPLSRSEIIELSPKKTWKASSIHILLNSMLEKEAIVVEGFTKTGSHYGRTFAPALTEAEYAASQIRQMDSFHKSQAETLTSVFTALVGEGLEKETLIKMDEMLKRMIEK